MEALFNGDTGKVTLSQKQRLFPSLLAQLISWSYANGYELTLGEAYRTPEQAAANAAAGKGSANSNHTRRLAVDLNLFINGEYRTGSEDHKPLGDYWVSLHPLCRWGGNFSRPDGNHYSLFHEGVS